ncbi:MAG: serine hydrolase [Patescibacteria group bacterium]
MSVLILVNVFFIFSFQKEGNDNSDPADMPLSNTQAYIFPVSAPSYLPVLNTTIERPRLSAKSAVIYDIRSSRYLYSKSPEDRLPVASLTKLLSAIAVLENLNLDDVVVVPEESLKVDGEKQTLYLDEKIKVRDLLKMMLVESSNDAAYALRIYASSSGVDMIGLMNRKAIELGMSNSIFHDPAGLNDDALSSTEDLVKLAIYSLKFDELWSTLGEKTTSVYSIDGKIEHKINSTNQLFGIIPDIIGGKTGYTDKALGCMLLVVDIPGKNDKIISIVLGSAERFTDTEKLVDWTRRAYNWE